MSDSSGSELLIGYVSLFISCAAFGFMFAPLKRLDAKDGVFVQWVQCSVVFMAGFVINIVRGLPPFNLVASIGGFLYATGTILSEGHILNVAFPRECCLRANCGRNGHWIGHAHLGICSGAFYMQIPGKSPFYQIVVGWCVAHFGLFNTKPQSVDSPILNYLGVLLTLFSGLMFVFVYSREGEQDENNRKTSPNLPLNTTARVEAERG